MESGNWRTKNSVAAETVAGYFVSGEDAYRAINMLMEKGFSASEVGAAFHSRTAVFPGRNEGAIQDESKLHPVTGQGITTGAGPASHTSAVTPAGLSTGAGSAIAGAGKPGPIPGAEIPSGLPTRMRSELASEARPSDFQRSKAASHDFPATGDIHPAEEGGSWWDKLTHAFGGKEEDAARREAVSDKSSLNFGTGEGHLGVYAEHTRPYSGSAFESAFSGMGIPPEHARRLTRELARGGAIVTVKAGSRNGIAETILEQNHGVIRYEPAFAVKEEVRSEENPDTHVEVYGEVHRIYPRGESPKDAHSRKAS